MPTKRKAETVDVAAEAHKLRQIEETAVRCHCFHIEQAIDALQALADNSAGLGLNIDTELRFMSLAIRSIHEKSQVQEVAP